MFDDLDKHLLTVGLVAGGVIAAGYAMAKVQALSTARAGFSG